MTRYEEYFREFWRARNHNPLVLHVRCKERQRGYAHEIVIRDDGSVTFKAHCCGSKTVLALCAEAPPEGHSRNRGCYRIAQALRPGSTEMPDKTELAAFMPRDDAARLREYLVQLLHYRRVRWLHSPLDADPLLRVRALSKKARWKEILDARLLREQCNDIERLSRLSLPTVRIRERFEQVRKKKVSFYEGGRWPARLYDYLYKLRRHVSYLP